MRSLLPFLLTCSLASASLDIGGGELAEVSKIEVERGYLATATVDDQDLHAAGTTMDITSTRLDTGWGTVGGNGLQYTGTPDKVEASISIHLEEDATSNYWARPIIELRKNGAVIAATATLSMQQNGAYSSEAALNLSFTDPRPGTNPLYTYTLRDGDNRTANATPHPYSQVSLEAIELIEVVEEVEPALQRYALIQVNGDDGTIDSGDPNGLAVNRVSAGVYDVTSTDWAPFAIIATPRTSDNNTTYDQRKISWQIIPNGYRIYTTFDDNGQGADPRVDEHFNLLAIEL